jgi:hypothetical protein
MQRVCAAKESRSLGSAGFRKAFSLGPASAAPEGVFDTVADITRCQLAHGSVQAVAAADVATRGVLDISREARA